MSEEGSPRPAQEEPAAPGAASAPVSGVEASDGAEPAELVVVSDLHLGEGVILPPAHYSPMEEFFHDAAFARLLEHLREQHRERPSRLMLLLNGDTFDFLTVTAVPDEEEARARGFSMDAAERRFGLNPTPAKSVYKLDVIAAGHPLFFAALARFVAAGHRLIILRGNHDMELFYKEVRDRIRQILTSYAEGPSMTQVRRLVRFHQWFYMEPGRLYVEHGNQYEASNSIRYPFHPLVRPRGRRSKAAEPMLDYPLGSLFVRYFYNGVHREDPYTPKVISFEQYLEFIRRYNLLDLLRIARDHYPFFASALGPSLPAGGSRPSPVEDERQEAEFAELELTLPRRGLLQQIGALKIHPMSASKLALVQEMLKPVFRRLLWTAALTLATLYIWMLIFNLIQATPWLAENVFGKTSLLAVFSVGTVVALFWLGSRLGIRLRRQSDETVEMCAQRAEQIAALTGVRLVMMGHTHVADIRTLADGRTVYANGGTWVTVDNPWQRLIPGARELTFLHVCGDELLVRRWNDLAGRIEPVPFFELGPGRSPERSRLTQHMPRPGGRIERSWLRSGQAARSTPAARSHRSTTPSAGAAPPGGASPPA